MENELIMISKVKNDLFDYPNRYIMQLEDGFKFSLDSLLLAEFVNPLQSDKLILDMCTGNAPVPLVLSLKTDAEIVGFEIQKMVSELAKESVSLNNLDGRIKIINDDVKEIGKYYKKGCFDIITCNPPYFKTSEQGYRNENELKMLARHEVAINLEEIFKIASEYLKNNGVFYLVHRSNRLDDIIYLAKVNNINVKELQFISTKKESASKIVLVKCVKKSKSGLNLRKEICVENLGSYQHLFERSN